MDEIIWSALAVEYYLAIERKNITLIEKRQSPKPHILGFCLCEVSVICKSLEIEGGLVIVWRFRGIDRKRRN